MILVLHQPFSVQWWAQEKEPWRLGAAAQRPSSGAEGPLPPRAAPSPWRLPQLPPPLTHAPPWGREDTSLTGTHTQYINTTHSGINTHSPFGVSNEIHDNLKKKNLQIFECIIFCVNSIRPIFDYILYSFSPYHQILVWIGRLCARQTIGVSSLFSKHILKTEPNS